MGYKFSLVLSREITDDESAILQDAGCEGAVFETDTLPTNADVIVTKMDFDDTVSPSLADAIQSALDAVKKVPELSVPGLTVPAQPAGPAAEEADKVIEGTVVESAVVEDAVVEDAVVEGTVVEDAATDEKPAAKKPAAKKTSTRKTTAKAAKGNGASAPDRSGSADNAAEPVGTAVRSS